MSMTSARLLKGPLLARKQKEPMVSGKPSILKRGDDHHPLVPPQRLPLFQRVLPAVRLLSASQVFSCPGQLQPVRGTNPLRSPSPAHPYPTFQAGKARGVSFIDSTLP
jgi:hypothetical protein